MPDIPEVKIYRTMVSDGTSIFPMPTIEHEGKFWLVPKWIEHKDGEWIAPERIICLDGLIDQDWRGRPNAPFDFAVNIPIPKSVFDGNASPAESAKYTVIELPPIRFPKPPSIH